MTVKCPILAGSNRRDCALGAYSAYSQLLHRVPRSC